MQINLTLIAQGLNFSVAYWMLRRFLFRPAVAFVQAEMQVRDQLISSIDKEAIKARELEVRKVERWGELQQDFAHNAPKVAGRTLFFLPISVRSAKAEPPKDGALIRLKDTVKRTLVERVGDAH